MTGFGKSTPAVIYQCKIIIMRYKTITVSSNSKTTFCFTSNGEEWSSLDDALNELAEDGWEIENVINQSRMERMENELRSLNQPILILKNNSISGLIDIRQQIQRQNDKISNLLSIIDNLQDREKYMAEENLRKQEKVLEKLKRVHKDYEKIQEKIDRDAYKGHELEALIEL